MLGTLPEFTRLARPQPLAACQGTPNIDGMSDASVGIVSVTGVDVTLRIADVGSRSYAFIIDWHARALLALAWFVCGSVIFNRHLSLATPPGHPTPASYTFGVVLPALAIYFLYHPLLEAALRGRTPGKRAAGVHIVARDGGTPSVGALLIRNLFRLVDSLPVFYAVGLLTCLISSQRVRIGDLAAGTLLVADAPQTALSLMRLGALTTNTELEPAAVDLVNELLGRWRQLQAEQRATMARALLVRFAPGGDSLLLAQETDLALRTRLQALLRGTAQPS